MEEHLIVPQNKLNIANFMLGLFVVLMPLWVFVFGCFGLTVSTNILLIIFSVGYSIFLLVLSLNFITSVNYRQQFVLYIKKPISIVAMILFCWIILASIITHSINANLILYVSLLFVFVSVMLMTKRHLEIFFNTLLIVVAISCILGIIDPANKFIPGFIETQHPFASFFTHPNHSGYIAAILSIFVFNLFNKSTTTAKHIYLGTLYTIYTYFLFLNGSFAPLMALFAVEIFETIYVWIKLKKTPIKMLCLLGTLIPLCFLSDIYPNIENLRTCRYNFFLECIAVFDNIFSTKILSNLGITEIAGSDGWARNDLIANTFSFLTQSPDNFIFGAGAGTALELKPHNVFLNLWTDFGILAPILFIAILVLLFIKKFKQQFNLDNLTQISSIITYLIIMMFGSIFFCSFLYFVVFLSLAFRPQDKLNLNDTQTPVAPKRKNKKHSSYNQ